MFKNLTSNLSKHDWTTKISLLLCIMLTIWWVILSTVFQPDDGILPKMIWGASYQLMALWGGVWGIIISKAWGGLKSLTGRAILAFAAGLILQTFGQSVFSIYNLFLSIEIPYPSLADVGFFGSIPLYIYGTILLAKASGVQLSLKSVKNKLLALFLPATALCLSYILILRGYGEFDLSTPVKTFLDFAYPLGQAAYVSIALATYLLTANTLGGIMKNRVLLILLALCVQYLADLNFLIQAIMSSWSVSGYGDMIYLVAYFLMSIGLIRMKAHRVTAS